MRLLEITRYVRGLRVISRMACDCEIIFCPVLRCALRTCRRIPSHGSSAKRVAARALFATIRLS